MPITLQSGGNATSDGCNTL